MSYWPGLLNPDLNPEQTRGDQIFFTYVKGGTKKNWRPAITDRRHPLSVKNDSSLIPCEWLELTIACLACAGEANPLSILMLQPLRKGDHVTKSSKEQQWSCWPQKFQFVWHQTNNDWSSTRNSIDSHTSSDILSPTNKESQTIFLSPVLLFSI